MTASLSTSVVFFKIPVCLYNSITHKKQVYFSLNNIYKLNITVTYYMLYLAYSKTLLLNPILPESNPKCYVVLTVESVDEILKCDHSNESY